MQNASPSQPERALTLLEANGIMRMSEFAKHGITGATLGRLERSGQVTRLGRGVYQLPAANLDAHHSLAEASKRVARGIICLTSALAFHELTDTIPSRVWLAIGPKDRLPAVDSPPIQIVRFGSKVFSSGVEIHRIEGVEVRLYCPAKTVVDMFRYSESAGRRYSKSPGLNLAIEGLRKALKKRRATPAQIAAFAEEAGVWKKIEPYLDAMIAND